MGPSIVDLASSTSGQQVSSTCYSLAEPYSHHRRRSSSSVPPQGDKGKRAVGAEGDSSGSMSLSRSPSPRPGGGWASPGLNSPAGTFSSCRSSGGSSVTWESAKRKSQGVHGYPAFAIRNNGFFRRHYRKISSSLPRFNLGSERCYAEKEKLGWGRRPEKYGKRLVRLRRAWRRSGRRTKLCLTISFALIAMYILFYWTPLHYWWRRGKYTGGGKKFVVILAANMGGGVMEWKGPRDWAIERDSVRNKRKYTNTWGYDLEIVDMSTKRRYAHEWRESWEKVDTIKNCMQKYPDAEWFWWLDLNTFIMEPSYSLQDHIFNDLASHTYRNINEWNPLNITHPFPSPYIDAETASPVGDGNPKSIDLIVPQDCGGFNLGSFFVRRSEWSDRLLDMWWDPVLYEQRHMQWAHKEQDALQHLYTNQPWVRPHTAFIPQRMINAFPPGACGDAGNDTRFHYQKKDRDFVVNMAGCEWGRDCWGEMYAFRELSNFLNRTWWERFKEDLMAVAWYKVTGRKIRI